MKIIIFTYDRFDTITTSRYFKNVEHTVLCHSDDDKQRFIVFTKSKCLWYGIKEKNFGISRLTIQMGKRLREMVMR